MKIWNMGNTTARNPLRLREAVQLFVARMSERPFRKQEQLEFQNAMIDAGLVESERREEGDDGGFASYAPAYLEWAVWRLFLAINDLAGSISDTRGFKIDEDMNPIHHARGGAADLIFTYDTFKIVCEMTLTTGSRQFAAEGEPVTRHVFKAIENSGDKPVYGLFVAKNVDPNTSDAFHNARYWRDWRTFVDTPIIALNIKQVIALIQRMRIFPVTVAEIRELFESILKLQKNFENGPAWHEAYSSFYEKWLASSED